MDYHTRESCFELTGQKLFTSNAVLELLDNQIISFFSGQKSMSETSGLGCWHCRHEGHLQKHCPLLKGKIASHTLCSMHPFPAPAETYLIPMSMKCLVYNPWHCWTPQETIDRRCVFTVCTVCSLSSDCRDWVLNCGKKYSLVVVRPHNALLLILRHDCSGSQEMVRTSLDGPL